MSLRVVTKSATKSSAKALDGASDIEHRGDRLSLDLYANAGSNVNSALH